MFSVDQYITSAKTFEEGKLIVSNLLTELHGSSVASIDPLPRGDDVNSLFDKVDKIDFRFALTNGYAQTGTFRCLNAPKLPSFDTDTIRISEFIRISARVQNGGIHPHNFVTIYSYTGIIVSASIKDVKEEFDHLRICSQCFKASEDMLSFEKDKLLLYKRCCSWNALDKLLFGLKLDIRRNPLSQESIVFSYARSYADRKIPGWGFNRTDGNCYLVIPWKHLQENRINIKIWQQVEKEKRQHELCLNQ